jgi:uncharacterized beta-barrel protein YwiB (DUF1934 family)
MDFPASISYNIKVIMKRKKEVMALTAETEIPVKIHLITKIRLDDEEETYELVVFGRYFKKNNKIYLAYEEVQEEGIVRSVVKIDENEAAIFRKGVIDMHLKFRVNEQKEGTHLSEFGSLLLSTSTRGIYHEESDGKCEGTVKLQYDLFMQGAHAGEYDMEINYKEEQAAI